MPQPFLKLRLKMIIFVRIKGSVSSLAKSEKDVVYLNKTQSKYKAERQLHHNNSMWFVFRNLKNALDFVGSINRRLPYLKWELHN